MTGSRFSLPPRLKGLLALVLIAVPAGVLWMLHLQAERDAALQAARYRAYLERREYAAQTLPCQLTFPSGGVSRVDAYADAAWTDPPAELASSQNDSEGEHWAEFHTTGSATAAEALLSRYPSDLRHPLLRQRLWALYFSGRLPEAVDELEGRLRVIRSGTSGDWRIRVAWIESPYTPIRVLPPADPQPVEDADLLGALRSGAASPRWQDPDAPEASERRWAFEQLAERTLATWSDPHERARERRRWYGERHHVYVIDAARPLGAGQVLILRRFGSLLGPGTLQNAGERVAGMIDSLICKPAEAP